MKKLQSLTLLICICLLSLTGCSHQYTESITMKKRAINPWTWQDRFGFVQANEVTGAQRMLFCAGQISVDDDGNLLHPGEMEKQMKQIVKNLETLFKQADVKMSDIVRITYYTTDIEAFTEANISMLSKQMKKWNIKAATSLIGVAALARPGCVVELEVTALASLN